MISNLSVNSNPPINLLEGNVGPLFLCLIIDSLLQPFAFWRPRCLQEDALWHRHGSVLQELWQRPSSKCHHLYMLDLGPCLCQGHQEVTVAIGAALLVAKMVLQGFHLFCFFLFLGKVLELKPLSLKNPHKNKISLR